MESIPQHQFADNFPLRFENGHVVDSVAFWCVKCGVVAHSSQIQGQVSRLLSDTADIRVMFCCRCGHTNHYRIRLKDDKSYTYLSDGIWRERLPSRASLISGVKKWCHEAYWYGKFRWSCFLLQRDLKRLQGHVRNHTDNRKR